MSQLENGQLMPDDDASAEASWAQLEAVVDGLADAFFAFDRGWCFRFVNARAAELLRRPRSELVGHSVYDLFPRAVAESQFVDVYRVAMDTGEPVSFEAYYEPAQAWMEVRAHPFSGGLSVYLTDVTERHTMLAELRSNEELMRAVFEQSGEGISMGTRDGRVVLYNDAMERISGYTMEEVNERGWFDLVYPDPVERARAQDLTRRALDDEFRYLEAEITRKDGQRRWAAFTVTSIVVDGVSNVLGSMVDITDRKRSELEREELLADLDAIDKITDVALSTLEPDQLLERVLGRLVTVMDAEVAIVSAAEGNWTVMRGDDEPVAQKKGLPSVTALSSFKRVDLSFGDEKLGTLEVGWARPRVSEKRDVRVQALAADRIATALSNARLHRKTVELARLNAALISINEAIHSSLDLDRVMSRALQDACRAMGVGGAAILLSETAGVRPVYQVGFEDVWTSEVVLDISRLPRHAQVMQTGQTVLISDAMSDTWSNREFARQLNVSAELLVALQSRGEAIGVLGFYYRDSASSFSDGQVLFAQNLATSIGLALDNARLYAAEHSIAEALQDALLEMPDRVGGLPIGCAYLSSRSMAGDVGGDFYDAFELEGGRIGLLVGDVSGKGLDAAVLTSLLKNAVRAHATDDDTPGVVMAKTNRLTSLQTDSAMFATALFGTLDVASGTFTFCNAGHPPALIRHADGSVDSLDANSPLIGAFEDMEYSETTTTLRPADVLLLYTDGVTEARRDRDQFGQARLEKLLAEAPRDPSRLVEAVLERITEFAEERLTDDVALLALSYEPRRDFDADTT